MQVPDNHSDLAVHEELLLRICAAPDADHGALIRQVDADGWNSLAQMAEDKRLCALVLRAVGIADARKLLPSEAAAKLESARQWHSLYALKQMAAVKRLIGVLAEGGFHPILLKGFGLAHGIYPDPALRPLRDVDLLLSADEAAQAQALLVGNAHYRIATWAGSYGLEFGHQLPEIQDIDFDLTIEIHHRVNARNWAQEPMLVELIRAEPVALPIMGIGVPVPSPRANFLHLLEHATLHHAFENGPLVLADLHFLACRRNLDWDWLEAEAERMGLARALRLVATVAWQLGGRWMPERFVDLAYVGAANLAAARSAMLQDREQSEQNKLMRRLDVQNTGETGWRAALIRALKPDPHQLAKIGGCRPDQLRRWLCYPVWLVQKGRRFLAVSTNEVTLNAARREADMVRWLGQPVSR
ncbi:nucleotidyltransferase domain-containing protein [Novosphingobium taihuense]|uniref:Uncharacterized protein n=1 Tax=Novosphingobium taihuense TaxID=260085 RepID=A0A7W7AEV1_9SPHN|nr:nucleotidyltransferase family protein [Novosphingobium taihuense]MBB4615742.1 hypothetical protein [Novosphingobium taihuense]TWH80155.1 putative nucleotidyltransferase-like protein [Novosphingobium taihuense]